MPDELGRQFERTHESEQRATRVGTGDDDRCTDLLSVLEPYTGHALAVDEDLSDGRRGTHFAAACLHSV